MDRLCSSSAVEGFSVFKFEKLEVWRLALDRAVGC
jgi:hypothetical protein